MKITDDYITDIDSFIKERKMDEYEDYYVENGDQDHYIFTKSDLERLMVALRDQGQIR